MGMLPCYSVLGKSGQNISSSFTFGRVGIWVKIKILTV